MSAHTKLVTALVQEAYTTQAQARRAQALLLALTNQRFFTTGLVANDIRILAPEEDPFTAHAALIGLLVEARYETFEQASLAQLLAASVSRVAGRFGFERTAEGWALIDYAAE